MSIRDRQLIRASNRALSSELLAGRFPDLTTIQDSVFNEIRNRPIGLPRFELQAVAEGDISSSLSYNTMMNQIFEDLNTMFDESGYQTDRLMAVVNYYETEKALIQMQLKRLNNRMDGLIDKLSHNVRSNVIFDTFQDFQNVEFIGRAQVNRPNTDAFIDLLKGEAVLNKISNGDRIDLSKAEISVTPITSYVTNTELSKPNLMLTDIINETWRQLIVTDNDLPVTLQIDIALDSEVSITSFSFESNSPKSTDITLSISSDGIIYQPYNKQSGGFVQWSFNTVSAKALRLTLTKYEADETTGTNNNYLFGCKSLAIYKEAYKERGIVVSRQYYIGNEAIDRITLQVDSSLPSNTDIRYYIAIDNDDLFEWQEIQPNVPHDMGGMKSTTFGIDSFYKGYGSKVNSQYGNDYYNIADIPYAIMPGSALLYMGENMWQHDLYNSPISVLDNPSLKDWIKMSGYTTNYIPLNAPMKILKNCKQRFTVNLYCETANIIDHNVIQVTEGLSSNVKFNVYLNNNLIKAVGDYYTYYLRAGWNKIQIITSAIDDTTIDKGFNLTYVSNKVYASNDPLRETSLYNLLNNTSKRDHTNFAIDTAEVAGKTISSIIVNYDPRAIDSTGAGVMYNLTYKRPVLQDQNALRFMAILSRDPSFKDISPSLRSYQIIVE